MTKSMCANDREMQGNGPSQKVEYITVRLDAWFANWGCPGMVLSSGKMMAE